MTCGICDRLVRFGENWAHVKRNDVLVPVHIRCVEKETYTMRFEQALTPYDRKFLGQIRVGVNEEKDRTPAS
jgi:hypothetical protein